MVNENGTTGRGAHQDAAGPSRSRRTVIPEEDATKLQFGEFADGEALTPTDVKTLLIAARAAPGAPPAPDNKVYKTALEYINEFSNASPDVIDSMRTALMAQPGFLNKFEMAQIMYLRPGKLEEAVALIPSLERYTQGDESQAQLEQLLDDVRGMVRYGARP